ncbi:MAG TPA: ATP-dependent Clp protease adapter ClpS [Acidimicrobiia bacterium]|nr:ATP-dependent Clp protease adapter ClpS [Acidimicrobiia bacterium]
MRVATARVEPDVAEPDVAEPDVAEPLVDEPPGETDIVPDLPWVVVVWNDPVNLMSYVVYVFQKLFGYSREKATRLMLDVHHKGKAAVSEGPKEKAEADVARLHAHGLWATMEKSGGA